jgi:multisubunit Na+/H+ antiporter MnhG subunit
VSVRDALTGFLLATGVGLELLAVAGVAAMADVYDRLHFLAPSTLGAIAIATAILVREGPSLIGLKGATLALILVVTSPILVHATARVARIAERGDWRAATEEGVEVESR